LKPTFLTASRILAAFPGALLAPMESEREQGSPTHRSAFLSQAGIVLTLGAGNHERATAAEAAGTLYIEQIRVGRRGSAQNWSAVTCERKEPRR
jgi:hypothetical protein